jgi:hypothetical protein
MYGYSQLKSVRPVTETHVPCPVLGCGTMVERRQKFSKKLQSPEYSCSEHRIFISPTTWAYFDENDNVVDGFERLKSYYKFKREHRIDSDNSEDALTWNVFQCLEHAGLLETWLRGFHPSPGKVSSCVYWSGERAEGGIVRRWEPLIEARKEFEEDATKGTEPDLIILTGNCLFIVEAKLSAFNLSRPSRKNFPKRYVVGGGNWFKEAFTDATTYQQIAEEQKRYELMRMWLLGSWMAKKLDRDFRLVSLVLKRNDTDLETKFGGFLKADDTRRFVRTTWEDIYKLISSEGNEGWTKLIPYMQEKTLGYREDVLQKAFDL